MFEVLNIAIKQHKAAGRSGGVLSIAELTPHSVTARALLDLDT
jgi:hypothetical protein